MNDSYAMRSTRQRAFRKIHEHTRTYTIYINYITHMIYTTPSEKYAFIYMIAWGWMLLSHPHKVRCLSNYSTCVAAFVATHLTRITAIHTDITTTHPDPTPTLSHNDSTHHLAKSSTPTRAQTSTVHMFTVTKQTGHTNTHPQPWTCKWRGGRSHPWARQFEFRAPCRWVWQGSHQSRRTCAAPCPLRCPWNRTVCGACVCAAREGAWACAAAGWKLCAPEIIRVLVHVLHMHIFVFIYAREGVLDSVWCWSRV